MGNLSEGNRFLKESYNKDVYCIGILWSKQ
jgi:hypothetical protein